MYALFDKICNALAAHTTAKTLWQISQALHHDLLVGLAEEPNTIAGHFISATLSD